MLQRLQAVGLTEEEFENYIRREPQDLFNNVKSEKLQALATAINKKDFMSNYDLSEDQYQAIDNRFDIAGQKAAMNAKIAEMNGGSGPSTIPDQQIQQSTMPIGQDEPVEVNFAPMGRAENDVNVQSGGGNVGAPVNQSNVVGAPLAYDSKTVNAPLTTNNLGASFAPMPPDNSAPIQE
jgi:hypothetical protein